MITHPCFFKQIIKNNYEVTIGFFYLQSRYMAILLLLPLLLPTSLTKAQYNISTTYSNHGDLNASRYEPSELNLGYDYLQIGMNYYLWVANNAIDYGSLKVLNDSTFTPDSVFVNGLVDKLKTNNIFGVGQDYQILGIAFQIVKGKETGETRYDFSLSVVDKFAMSLNYTKNLMKLVWRGNEQFRGQTIELGPLSLNANYTREYVLGTAFPILSSLDNIGFRFGFRAKYIHGLGSIYMPKSNATMYTEQEGKYIIFDFDYQVKSSGISNFSPTTYNGNGFGLDAGISIFLGKNFEIVASVLDVGGVNYNKDINVYQKHGIVRYEGFVISDFFGDINAEGQLDSLGNLFLPDTIAIDGYYMPSPTKIMIQAEFKTATKGRTRIDMQKNLEFTSNSFYITYIQGLNDMPGNTTTPFISVAYNHDFHKKFDIGISAAVGGYNRLSLGAFFTLKMGRLRLGLGSDNLTALVYDKLGTGIDLSVNLSSSFTPVKKIREANSPKYF